MASTTFTNNSTVIDLTDGIRKQQQTMPQVVDLLDENSNQSVEPMLGDSPQIFAIDETMNRGKRLCEGLAYVDDDDDDSDDLEVIDITASPLSRPFDDDRSKFQRTRSTDSTDSSIVSDAKLSKPDLYVDLHSTDDDSEDMNFNSPINFGSSSDKPFNRRLDYSENCIELNDDSPSTSPSKVDNVQLNANTSQHQDRIARLKGKLSLKRKSSDLIGSNSSIPLGKQTIHGKVHAKRSAFSSTGTSTPFSVKSVKSKPGSNGAGSALDMLDRLNQRRKRQEQEAKEKSLLFRKMGGRRAQQFLKVTSAGTSKSRIILPSTTKKTSIAKKTIKNSPPKLASPVKRVRPIQPKRTPVKKVKPTASPSRRESSPTKESLLAYAKIAKSHGGFFVRRDSNGRLVWKCAYGHLFKQYYKGVQDGKWCWHCARTREMQWRAHAAEWNKKLEQQWRENAEHEQESLFKSAKKRMAREIEAHRQHLETITKAANGKPNPKSKDPFICLGLPRNATSVEIKKRYRRLALQFHPDKNASSSANEFFCAFTVAYETLNAKHG